MNHQAFDSSYFRGKSHFEDDETQYYFVFPPVYRYFKENGDNNYISTCISKEASDNSIKPAAYDNSLASVIN